MSDPIDTQGAVSDVYVASKQKPENRYGQGGYQGPSSDLPGQHTVMNRELGVPDVPATNNQTRDVSAEQLMPLAYGARNRSADGVKIAPKLDRASSGPAARGSFKR
ncbi:hypothetical protein QNJ95_42670 [Bradyrhizobium elkanii]|uniref:hypothetical protein n=1 Tax=Bradyrhizobium TaxID=374 RepID=UPI00271203B4|nr:hypothetical protein [Bradyrhizobium elkanii]WLA39475.1 hypothetical protein QNJ95_42670 [Bradyrhizobium elkanii]